MINEWAGMLHRVEKSGEKTISIQRFGVPSSVNQLITEFDPAKGFRVELKTTLVEKFNVVTGKTEKKANEYVAVSIGKKEIPVALLFLKDSDRIPVYKALKVAHEREIHLV